MNCLTILKPMTVFTACSFTLGLMIRTSSKLPIMRSLWTAMWASSVWQKGRTRANSRQTVRLWTFGLYVWWNVPAAVYAMHFNHSSSRDHKRVYYRFIDYDKFTLNDCPTPPIQLKPKTGRGCCAERNAEMHCLKPQSVKKASLMPKQRVSKLRLSALTAKFRNLWKSSLMQIPFCLITFRNMWVPCTNWKENADHEP